MAQLTDKQMELLNAWNTLSNSYNKNGLYQAGGYKDTIASGQNTLADTYFKQKGADTAGFSDEQLQQIQNNAMQGNQPKDQSKDLTPKSSVKDTIAGGLRGISDINDNILNAGGGVLDGIFDAGVDFAGQLTNSQNADWVKDLKDKTNAETFQLPLSVAADLGLMAAGPGGWAALAGKSLAENGDNFADAITGVDENGNELTNAQRGLSAAAGLGGTALGMIPAAGGALSKMGGKVATKELEKTAAANTTNATPELTALERFAKNYADDLSLNKPEGQAVKDVADNKLYAVMDKALGRNAAGEAVSEATEEVAKNGVLNKARNAIGKGLKTAGKPIDFVKQQLPTQLAAQGTTIANLVANGADANDIMEYFSNPANVASMLLASKMSGNKANAARFNTPRNLYGNAAFVNEAGNAADNYYGRTEESQDLQDVEAALSMVGDPKNQAELYALLLNDVDTSGLNLERDYPKENK